MDTHQNAPETIAPDATEGDNITLRHAAVAREKSDPTISEAGPVSLWLFLVFAVVLMFGGNYIGKLAGNFSYDAYVVPGYTPEPAPGMEGVVVQRPWIDEYMALGKKRFGVCAGCHGSNGEGNPASNYPPLAGSEWVTGPTEKLGLIILAGLQGPITVKGKTYVNVMPSQAAGMTANDLGAVMTYARRSFGNDASIVTPEMAQAVFDIQAARVAAGKSSVTADELLASHANMLPGAEVDPLTGKPSGAAPATDAAAPADGAAPTTDPTAPAVN